MEKRGIVIGKVQSGKTSNFIALTALAFDNKYNIAIILGGNKNNLLNQNADRIKKYFKNIDSEKLVILTTNQNETLLQSDNIKQFINEGRKVIIVGLKHQKHINEIAKIFENTSLSDEPTLIIDDEGDQATLNTKVFSDNMSAIYKSVIELKNKINRHCFISITATPQANILINTVDLLSPDFGILVYPGEEYCGLNEFHGEDQDKYIKVIPDSEESLIESDGLPLSFYNAFADFFVGGALRQYRGDNGKHAMLIHPSQRKIDHQIVIEKIKSILEDWRDKARIKISKSNDISYKSLEIFLKKSYERYKDDEVKLPDYNELEPYVLNCILKCSPVHLCNSDEDASVNSEYYKLNIFVGGNMVERGITIKGLAVTYIIRRAKGKSNVDNMEQRARWFGYKKRFLDVCRVYTTKQIKKDFSNILECDEDLWALIERAHIKGTEFKKIPRIFILSSQMLNLTRTNVARTERVKFSQWTKQNILELDRNNTMKNTSLINNYKEVFKDKLEILNFSGSNKHLMLKNADLKELKKMVLDNMIFPTECNIQNEFFDKLGEALEKCGINPIVDIVWIRDIDHETRSVEGDGYITSQMFQGYNSKYCGDANIITPDRNEIMQLQIHYIKPKNLEYIDYYCPALALYIPLEYSEKMSNLVKKL